MRRQSIGGRRGALVGASAAVVCLGSALAACGAGSGGGGYVAVQHPASGPAVAPTGDVELIPLEEAPASEDVKRAAGGGTSGAGTSGGGSGAPGSGTDTPGGGRTASPGGAAPGTGAALGTGPASGTGDADSGRTGGSSSPGTGTGTPPATPATPAAPGPAVLTTGAPERASADQRWCERVTVSFRNTGGTAVRSGAVTFGTHIIGALGVDWATIESAEELPVPIAAGAARTKTWTVCVEAWRVPLGMHVETRDVSVDWR
ncbi:hypothetical protein [Streptomyces sp. NPDC050535]|uniref:hypothetical protein n=1 Tax=Streptomyces sp. NPDC050535 TaxID=3365626 RepID=UPI0037AC5A8A